MVFLADMLTSKGLVKEQEYKGEEEEDIADVPDEELERVKILLQTSLMLNENVDEEGIH